MQTFLEETSELNFSHTSIQTLVSKVQASSLKDIVIELYYLVRDGVRYNPYTFVDGEETWKASYAASNDEAYCVPKAALMVAACRAKGIPAKLGLADVRNHLSSPKLLSFLKTDLFVMHGYASIYIEGKWVKCTPVFNKELCEKFAVKPLEFDGDNDSIFHEHTVDGRDHMEYVKDHGTFDDVPVEFMKMSVAKAYPHLELDFLKGSVDKLTDKAFE